MAKNENIKVLIIDNNPLFILGLSSILDKEQKFSIIGSASNCADALKIAEKESPKLVLMEIRLGNENGLELIPKLKSLDLEMTILVMSLYDERSYAERVLRLGARGYILKTESADTVMDAINTILNNKVYLSESERDRILQSLTEEPSPSVKDWVNSLQLLSTRELQVLSFIAKGLGTIEIASRLNLSTKTVDTHKEHVKQKLHCNTVQELRQKAIEWFSNSDNI
jgi:DNA-binding NarL/FixJ family response regulator